MLYELNKRKAIWAWKFGTISPRSLRVTVFWNKCQYSACLLSRDIDFELNFDWWKMDGWGEISREFSRLRRVELNYFADKQKLNKIIIPKIESQINKKAR